jgi:putative ABC transport system permease protein
MKIGSIFTLAIKSIMLNKSRSFLTMLGVIIGVGSVVLLTSIGTGLQAYVADQFASLGTNILYVVPGNPFGNGGFSGGGGAQTAIESSKPTLKRTYYNQVIRNNRDLIKDGAITSVNVAEAKYSKTTKKVTLYGITNSYQTVYNSPAAKGRWFTQTEEDKADRIVLLGPKIATELFGQVDPINKFFLLNGQSYKIIGVLKEKGGGFGGPSFDNYVYIPIETNFKYFNSELINSFVFEVRDKSQIKDAKLAIEKTIGKSLKSDEFTVFDQTQLLSTINSIIGMLTIGLGGISAISLLVGGIGIMNIMLVSVTERTREIGLRKALGATPNLILAQFLIEAALLSVIGGLIGLLIAYLGSLALQPYFPAKVTMGAVILSFGVSTIVGLVFGVAPAKRAAKLSPIEALRYE